MNATTNGYKYIKLEQYQIFESNISKCEGDVLSGFYQLSGWCNGIDQLSRTICNDDGTIETNVYDKQGCEGSIAYTIQIPVNTCSMGSSFSCVDSIGEIPSNSLIGVTTNNTCQDDPNWKNQINVISY